MEQRTLVTPTLIKNKNGSMGIEMKTQIIKSQKVTLKREILKYNDFEFKFSFELGLFEGPDEEFNKGLDFVIDTLKDNILIQRQVYLEQIKNLKKGVE